MAHPILHHRIHCLTPEHGWIPERVSSLQVIPPVLGSVNSNPALVGFHRIE